MIRRFYRWLYFLSRPLPRHLEWHVQYPELYWQTNGDRFDPDDFIACPFCQKRYEAPLK